MGGRHQSYFADNKKEGMIGAFEDKCAQIEDEISALLRKLDPECRIFEKPFRSGGVKSTKTGNDFRNLLWWNIKLKEGCLTEKYEGYTNMLLSADRASIDDFSRVKIGNCDSYPHVDKNTGNIHVSFDIFEWVDSDKTIQQAVLAGGKSDPGPKLGGSKTGHFEPDELITYDDGVKKISVPKACYYPKLDSNDSEDHEIGEYLFNLLDDKLTGEIKEYLDKNR